MDAQRLKRYKDKLGVISIRKGQIAEWINRISEGEMPILACYKAFQEMAEAALDIVAMIIRDSNDIPKDDYMNIDTAVRNGILNKNIADALKQANGLRNRLVHEYNGLDVQRAHDSMIDLIEYFDEFLETVEKWLEQK